VVHIYLRVPSGAHGLDDAANDELSALGATRRIENVETMLAILAVFKLIENSIRKSSEALGTSIINIHIIIHISILYIHGSSSKL